MREVIGDIWDYHRRGHWIVITTNGSIRKDGCAVMGRGVAKQAKEYNPNLPYEIGRKLKYRESIGQERNIPFFFYTWKLATFPVKHNWWERADLRLIENSAMRLSYIHIVMNLDSDEEIYMVRPGCGNGRLDWKDVKPILEKYLDDRFIVVEKK